VWIYDLRTGMPPMGKRTPLSGEHLRDFECAFGEDPRGGSPRTQQGSGGRFRCFSRQELRARGDSLDISWLAGPSAASGRGEKRTPHGLTVEILGHLRAATAEIEALAATLAP
jgi:type I restriction enzyme M protein